MTPTLAFLLAAAIIGLILGLNMYELRASRLRKSDPFPEPFTDPRTSVTQRFA